MTLSLRLRPATRADLDDIWDYTFAHWGVEQADDYLRSIHTMMQRLRHSPHIGRACDEIIRGYRQIRVGSHIIFYRIADSELDVIRVMHQRMDHQRLRAE